MTASQSVPSGGLAAGGGALVAVVVTSRTEFNIMRRGLETLRVMGAPYVLEVISAHRSPERLGRFAAEAGARGIEVIVCACSAAGAPGIVAAHTTLPVIGVPIDASPLRGQDTLFATVMAPTGAPVATVGINASENAAILAVQVLAIKHPAFRTVLAHRRMTAEQRLDATQKELYDEFPDLCLPERTVPVAPEASESDTEPGAGFPPGSDPSETPTPPDASERIRPGAVYVERASGPTLQALVSTPSPHEPRSQPAATKPATLQSLFGPARPPATGEDGPLTAPSNRMEGEEPTAPLPPSPEPLVEEAAAPVSKPPPIEPAPPREPRIDTKVFRVSRTEPDMDVVDHAMMVILEGGIVALPTDTVYGLAVDATNEEAVQKLYRLKGREHQKTMGVLIHHTDMLEHLVKEVPPAIEKVMEECWPGALTIVLPKQPDNFSSVSPSDRIGIRIPDDEVCLTLLSRVGRPVAMRNASLNPMQPMRGAKDVVDAYLGHVDCIIDAGDCPSASGASSVLNATQEPFDLLREGDVSRDRLAELLGDRLKTA